MKKRFLSAFLALALCMGLAVPAFAADVGRDPLPRVSIDLPFGYTTTEKTDIYQIRHFHTVDTDDAFRATYIYDEEPIGEEIACTALPLGTHITINGISGISALPGEPAADGNVYYNYSVSVSAYSDPDKDGVFDQRIFFGKLSGTVDGRGEYSVVSASENGPFAPPKNDDWSRHYTSVLAMNAGFDYHDGDDRNAPCLVATTDILYQLFGPNTLIRVAASASGAAGSEPEEVICFRLIDDTAAPPAITVSVSNPDDDIAPMDNAEFTLRNITEEFFPDNRLSAIHTDFTRDEEPVTVELDNLPTLTVKGVINICGIQTVSDGQKPWDGVYLSAWSDPDGDGVYDQQLFSFYPSTDSVNMVPLSNPGPFSYGMIDYTDGGPIYSRFINFNTDGMPTSNPYSAGDIPSSIILSGNYLTWLFGPNTLVQIQAATAGEYQDGSLVREESTPFYAYIPKDATAAPAFNDVPAWFREAVNWAAENGVTTGTSYYKFSPDKDCTQAQILTFLWRAAQEPRTDTPCPVTLPASLNYAESALAWAAEKGMIDGSLDPKAPCTRAQAVSYIWQALGKEEAQAGSFPDVDAGADYAAAVAWAVENGVTNGFDSGDGTFQFRPGKVCSRGEIAAFLHRAYVPEAKLNAR